MHARRSLLLASLLWLASSTGAEASTSPGPIVSLLDNCPGPVHTEIGDAGDHTSPQDIAATVCRINGTIGSVGPAFALSGGNALPAADGFDPVDAFRFYFAGGDIRFIGAVFLSNGTGPSNGSATAIPLPLWLYDNDGIIRGYAASGDMTFIGLAAGVYIIEGTFLTDPPFSIGILTPDGLTPVFITPPRQAAEPDTMMLLAGALAVMALGMTPGRRKRPSH